MYVVVVVIGGFVFEWDLNIISQVINDLECLAVMYSAFDIQRVWWHC